MKALAALALLVAGAASAQQPMIFAPGERGTIAVGTTQFTPPDPSTIPDTPLGEMIRFGRGVFVDTQRYAKPYVGNGVNCVNCHLDDGRIQGRFAESIPSRSQCHWHRAQKYCAQNVLDDSRAWPEDAVAVTVRHDRDTST